MSKWKWIAQDVDGAIFKYVADPYACVDVWLPNNESYSKAIYGDENINWNDTKINLDTEDYEIVNGILKRLPRKTKLDELIARVKLIDKKAAKWINKNRHLCNDINNFNALFCLETPQGYDYWIDIRDRLDSAPTPPKQTVRYRVGLHKSCDNYYTHNANSEIDAKGYESLDTFVKWLTVWIEVEV